MNPLIQSKTTTRIASNSLNRAPMQRALVLVPMALTCTFRVTWRRIWDSTLVHTKSFRRRGLCSSNRISQLAVRLHSAAAFCFALLTDL
jgi:hypothetical protein